jgi:hypothetical protein
MVGRVVAGAWALLMVVAFVPGPGPMPAPEGHSGCCSHHGGLAGGCCKGTGTLVCNDGTCSPTCGC